LCCSHFFCHLRDVLLLLSILGLNHIKGLASLKVDDNMVCEMKYIPNATMHACQVHVQVVAPRIVK
jgi:hypothetical protein